MLILQILSKEKRNNMIHRIPIYTILVLIAGIAYLGLIIKLQKNEIDQYKQIEKIEIKKQKITNYYVKKIQKIKVPSDDIEFERMLTKIFAD